MFRFLFRVLATISLAIAVIMAVLDVTRTIAASRLVMTSLQDSWNSVSPSSFGQAQALIVDKTHPLVWNPVMTFILGQPGFAVFGALALLLYAIGHRPERRLGHFLAER